MKANIETVEPVIRPVAAKPAPVSTARSTVRPFGFAATMAQPVLFHAWRA